MGKISTHVLDTTIGMPAVEVRIDLSRKVGDGFQLVKTVVTNEDGRTDNLLPDANEFNAGEYELLFHIGHYYAERIQSTPQKSLFDQIPVRFTIDKQTDHYHIPLLITPWCYSTYRGS